MSAQIGSASPLPAALRKARSQRPAGWMATLRHLLRLMETRQHLAELDDRLLRDIGMSRPDAQHEARRPVWDYIPRG
ncbi:DUF1127 domain-containing protein [Roseomonas sp. GC11]|uniref:DUF1127 domain-containing protein n=1 Tax=Roseomonas sp. GC11 TaxID=2950546 RepID=UPI00210A4437|nr:DUF1127 domain-containing protein [Roseomonas sp. GC11]MCQ4162830.1 DUF1127 domain-containing protein [Roseomonas sp. GC11]